MALLALPGCGAARTQGCPCLVLCCAADGGSPVFRARGLCHPAGLSGSGGVFVPNDVQLGGDSPPFVVLTGDCRSDRCGWGVLGVVVIAATSMRCC